MDLNIKRKIEHTILSVDFDDTITVAGPFPTINGLQLGAKDTLHTLAHLGFQIIINTCRAGESEQQVVDFLTSNSIPYHYINENHPTVIERFGMDCRKIYGDFMVDDKCLFFRKRGESSMPWGEIYRMIMEEVTRNEYEPLLLKLEKLQQC